MLKNVILYVVYSYRHNIDGTAETMGEGELSDIKTKGIVEQINRVLSVNLAEYAPHLYEAEVNFSIEFA